LSLAQTNDKLSLSDINRHTAMKKQGHIADNLPLLKMKK
jgi:hypothetical protein